MTELYPISPERRLLSDTVAQRLSQQIIGQAMMPGDALPSEGDIGKRLGVSKPVVREAIRKLAALGIIEIRQGKPSTVGQLAPEPMRQMLRFALHMNPEGLREAVELRRALEAYTVRRAAELATDEDVARLRGALARLEESVADHDVGVQADIAFHQMIAHLSRNSLMAFLIDALADSMAETISTMRRTKGPDASTIQRHRALVDTIARHDPEAATKAMDDHFAVALAVADEIIAERTKGGSGEGTGLAAAP